MKVQQKFYFRFHFLLIQFSNLVDVDTLAFALGGSIVLLRWKNSAIKYLSKAYPQWRQTSCCLCCTCYTTFSAPPRNYIHKCAALFCPAPNLFTTCNTAFMPRLAPLHMHRFQKNTDGLPEIVVFIFQSTVFFAMQYANQVTVRNHPYSIFIFKTPHMYYVIIFQVTVNQYDNPIECYSEETIEDMTNSAGGWMKTEDQV